MCSKEESMKKNKVIDWVKKHKISLTGIVESSFIGILFLNYKTKKNTEGTKLWFKYATLSDLYKYRDKIQELYNNPNVDSRSKYYWLLHYIDERISKIKWGNKPIEISLPSRENG